MSIRILQGDCRDLLATMEPSQFDACMADPPYGDTSLEWDSVVDGWVPAVARVLKPAASLWIFGSMRFFMGNRVRARLRAEGFRYSQDIVWEKQNGTGFHNDRFRRVHEHAVLFYRGAWRDVFHQTQFTMDATAKTVRRKTRPTHTGHIEAGHYVSEDGGPRMMRSVLKVRNEHGRAIHPTQKPTELLAPLIRYSVPPGGSFIVPFCGSGSDLLVAQAEGLTAVACEKDPEHFANATKRVASIDGPLFTEPEPA
jgi:site-specific DNA-methyltransferase (adenine-specific)